MTFGLYIIFFRLFENVDASERFEKGLKIPRFEVDEDEAEMFSKESH